MGHPLPVFETVSNHEHAFYAGGTAIIFDPYQGLGLTAKGLFIQINKLSPAISLVYLHVK